MIPSSPGSHTERISDALIIAMAVLFCPQTIGVARSALVVSSSGYRPGGGLHSKPDPLFQSMFISGSGNKLSMGFSLGFKYAFE